MSGDDAPNRHARGATEAIVFAALDGLVAPALSARGDPDDPAEIARADRRLATSAAQLVADGVLTDAMAARFVANVRADRHAITNALSGGACGCEPCQRVRAGTLAQFVNRLLADDVC